MLRLSELKGEKFRILIFIMLLAITSFKVTPSNAQKNKSSKKGHVKDQMEIRELLHSYLAYVDLHDNEGYVNTFAKNGVYESPFGIATGHDEIRKKLERWHGSGITNNKRHFAGTVISQIDKNGKTATSNSNFWVAETTSSATIVCTGYYEDKLIKE
ncbi:nuclear transport factor 2 family protein, partial [Xanthovirga aplysinae]|uniref:nuclear transport factor 2 family protein n=1 Tax=Xanthovirga aplysinae TaxID=2529853 RepID=UPI0012BC572C